MSFELKIHELAYFEYINSYQWYEAIRVGLGIRFMQAVEIKLKKITDNPEYFGRLKGNFRSVKVDGFPYSIIYEVFPRLKIIHVVAIFQMKRNPKTKFRKI